jgi:hypothetical protein
MPDGAMALPRGTREANEISSLGKSLGENHPIELQNFSERPPKPSRPIFLETPNLVVDPGDLPAAAREVRDLLAASGSFFDRGGPVKVVHDAEGGPPRAVSLNACRVVVEAHRLCRPVRERGEDVVPVTLSDRVARMYLNMAGEWNLPALAGITTAPVLGSDGSARTAEGFDSATNLWCANVPPLPIPDHPTRADAEAALRLVRRTFRTFPFADAQRQSDPVLGGEVVDPAHPPGLDESTFLAGLLKLFVGRACGWPQGC